VTIVGNSKEKEMAMGTIGLMVLVAAIEAPFFFVGASWWNHRHP
jgi:hypothetical protein